MLIDRQVGKSSPKARVEYLLYGVKGDRDSSKVDILQGNADLFVELAEKNPYSVKTYNFLISFAESREELEKKLAEQGKTIEELYEEILSLLLPAEFYPRENLNVLAVGHSDTSHFHIHLTIENRDYGTGKSLYIPKTRTEIKYYRTLEKYISSKYDLSFSVRARNKGKTGVLKVKQILAKKGKYREKTRDEIKEELTQYFTELILSGEITSRDEIAVYLGAIDGVEITRIGEKYISFRYEGLGEKPLKLKGGIYDRERFREVVDGLTGKKPDYEEVAQLFEVVRRERENLIGKRRKREHRLEKGISTSLQPSNEQELEPLERGIEFVGDRIQEKGLDSYFSIDWLTVANDRDSSIQTFWSELSFSLRVGNNQGTEISLLRDRGQGYLPERWRELERVSVGENSHSYTLNRLKELKEVKKDIREIRQQEIQLLKEIDPEEVLNALGIDDYREMDGYLLMSSPIREGDEHPSFAVFWGDKRNCWIYCDYGIGWAGSSIDLWQKVMNLDYVDAVREMREEFGINLLEQERDLKELKRKVRKRIEEQRERQKEKRKKLKPKEALNKIAYRILEVKDQITNPKLLDYLRKRGIHRIPSWLSEIHYKHLPTGKKYYGLAVRNYSGAWNVRSALEKGKYVVYENPEQRQTFTWIVRREGNKKVAIVEGMFDALSLEQIARKDNYDIVILNGVGNYKDLLKSGILDNYKEVILALDNDERGKETQKILIERLKIDEKIIKEIQYSGKDLNECLVEHKVNTVKVKLLEDDIYQNPQLKNSNKRLAKERKLRARRKNNGLGLDR